MLFWVLIVALILLVAGTPLAYVVGASALIHLAARIAVPRGTGADDLSPGEET